MDYKKEEFFAKKNIDGYSYVCMNKYLGKESMAQGSIVNFWKKFHQKSLGQGTIGTKRFVRDMGTFGSPAQGTIEYLVILAVVVVIGLVVVSISTGFFDSASGIATTSRDIDSITTSGIVVREAIVGLEGDGLFSLNNNTGQTLTLTKVVSESGENTFNKQITSGSTEIISLKSLDLTCSCEPGQTTNTCTFDIYYTSRYGIEQKITQTMTVECMEQITPSNPEKVTNPEYTFLTQNCFDQGQDPVPICTLSDLNRIREDLNSNYELKADIDASTTKEWDNGQGWEPIGNNTNEFIGTFNGKNYRIKNLYINKTINIAGFFGSVNNPSVIKNVGLEEINFNIETIEQSLNLGGLIGSMKGGTVINIYTTGELHGINTSNLASVGGLIGNVFTNLTHDLNIKNSFSKVNVSADATLTNIGGLIGFAENTIINNSYSTGNITISQTNLARTGGLIGTLSGTNGTILGNSYSKGNIITPGNFSGGLIGDQYDNPTIINSFWDINSSNQQTSSGGQGKTTLEMKQENTFTGWDFDEVWAISPNINNGYPYLKWETK